MVIIRAQIIKSVGGDFTVKIDEQILVVKGRKKLKDDKLLVGDFVEVDEKNKVIEALYPRKNKLIRPPLANIEQALIVVAPLPKPDFLLIDKLLIKFFSLKIKPVIIINKIDLCATELVNEICSQYKNVYNIQMISALDFNQTSTILNPILSGKFSILTGQSAVGKTSILNALKPEISQEVGELSRIGRGKNTTRHSEIYVLENGAMLADTPGFNALELDEFTPEDIIDNYPEFDKLKQDCRYNNCNHIHETLDDCAVKRAVENKLINGERYNRYVTLYNIAKVKESKKYG